MSMPRLIRLLACAAAALGAPLANAQAIGSVTHLAGTLSVARAGQVDRLLAINSPVNEGDLLTTERETYARIKFSDGAEIVLRPNSQLQVQRYRFDANRPEADNMLFAMVKGGMRAVTGLIGRRNRDRVGITTPTATVGIRGTHFGLLYCQANCAGIPGPGGRALPDGLHVDVAGGIVIVTTSAGSAIFNPGQFGYVANATTLPQVLPPGAGIRVTMPGGISTSVATRGLAIGVNRDDTCVAQ
jgi:hypothetical protein